MAVGELWLDCNYDEEGKLVYDQDSHRQASDMWSDLHGLCLLSHPSETPCFMTYAKLSTI